MARESLGGAYVSRGSAIMRVVTAPGVRTPKVLPWVTPEQLAEHGKASPCGCVACVRAREVQALVNRLREAGQGDFIENLVKSAAVADTAKMAELVRAVDGIVGGKIVKAEKAAPPAGSRALDTLADRWLTSVSALYDERTHATLTQYAARWPDLFGVATIDAIDGPALAGFVAKRLGAVTRTTVKKELWAVRAFLTWAHEVARILDTLPPFPRLPKRATGVRAGRQRDKVVELTREQVESLLDKLATIHGGRALHRYTFAAETGLRPETIDRIELGKHWQKGAAEVFISADIDKARWERMVPISERAAAALAAAAPSEPGPIFGTRRYVEDFKAAAKAAGLPASTAPYDLRHAFGTHAIEATGELTGTAYALGHKQVTTTNRYVHSNQKSAERVVSALSRSRLPGYGSGCKEPSGAPSRALCTTTLANDSALVRRRGLEPLQPCGHWNLNESDAVASTNAREVTHDHENVQEHSARQQPRPAAASLDDLVALVSELRGMVADLRAENRALREQLGEKRAAPVVDLASRRGRK